jgi:heat-inducible transcriptional repressor
LLRPFPKRRSKMDNILNDRQKTVLKEVCEAFISNGTPVGSRVLAKTSALLCSPATIRNEMADLEEMGYLCSPHTSAGRVPTEKGYKFYVNFLIEYEKIGQKENFLIKKLADSSKKESVKQQDILKSAIKYACDKTQLPGILLAPQQGQNCLSSVKLFRILSDKAMLVTVDDCGNINNKVVNIPEDTTDEVLEKLSILLNVQLCHQQYHQYEHEYLEKSRKLISRYNNLLSQLVKHVENAGAEKNQNNIFMEGFINFLEQPEFSSPERMREMVALLNQKDEILNLLANSLDNKGEIMVNIGSESGLAVKDMSLVTARYEGPNKTFGQIGLIGPLRMNYVNVVATLARLSHTLSELLIGNNNLLDE